MRHVPVLGAVVLLLVLGGPASCQVGRDIRFVNVEVAEVRAGPSDKPEFYVTNRLRRGQPVEVVGEEPGGWLAIRPPEGSFSYVNTRFLHHMYPDLPNHVVKLEGVKVPVFIGSEVIPDRRPTIRGAELEPGAQVTSRGKPKADEEGTWMPIEAPARERRFIRASQVVKTMPIPGSSDLVRASASPDHSAPAVMPTTVSTSNAPSANPPASPEVMWRKAQQAERNGQVTEAVRLYALLGAETTHSHPTLSSRALERAGFLQGGYQNYGAGVGVVQPPTLAMAGPSVGRTYPLPGTTVSRGVQVGPPATPRASAYPAAVTRITTLERDSSSFTPQPTTGPPRGTPSTWMGYRGVLRRAGRVLEGQNTYALEDPVTLRPVLYAAPGAGVNLDVSLNRVVELWGYTVYRGDLKNNYMIAVQIRPGR